MVGILAHVAGGYGQVIRQLRFHRDIPLLDDSWSQHVREYANTAAWRSARCGGEVWEAIGDLLAGRASVVLDKEIVNVRRIHRQAAVRAGRFQVVQNAIRHAHDHVVAQTLWRPRESEPRLEALL